MDELHEQILNEKAAQERERSERQDVIRKKAEDTVNTCTGFAALVGLLPIPLSDAPLIIITQAVMLKKLTGRYGRPLGFSLALIVFSAMIGPELFKATLKLIPGLGSLAGALVAGGCTWLVGRSALGVLEADQPFTLGNLKEAFINALRGKDA